MKSINILIGFLVITLIGCSSVGGFYERNPVLVNIIENSIGKPVDYFYDQLQNSTLNTQNIQSKAMTNEEHEDFGIEMKLPKEVNKSTSEIILRIRFDMHRKAPDSSQNTLSNTYMNRPKVFQKNGKYIVEFIRVIEYENNKIIFSRVFDKSLGLDYNKPTEYISSIKHKNKK